MTRKTILIILIVVLIVVSWQVFLMAKENKKIKDNFKKLANQLESVKKENEILREEIDYSSKPENLEKELRARFNYKKSDEKMLIITQ